MVFVDTAEGLLTIAKLHLSVAPPTIIDAWTADFLNTDSLIRDGYYLVQLDWEAANGQTFSTLGTMDGDGKPMFEPILHFNSREEAIQPRTNDRGKQEESWKRHVKNGLGCTCVEVEWKVKIQTGPDNCRIVDPAPHVEITKQVSKCWGWEQATTKGQVGWCNPVVEECVCSNGQQRGEDCIKWAVVTYVATGFSNVKVNAGAKGTVKGVTLDAKVDFEVSRLGSEATYEKIGNLCAKTGAK